MSDEEIVRKALSRFGPDDADVAFDAFERLMQREAQQAALVRALGEGVRERQLRIEALSEAVSKARRWLVESLDGFDTPSVYIDLALRELNEASTS